MTIDEIIENFSLLDEWDDRYRYVIELGRTLPPLPETQRNEINKVQGCASQVWLATTVKPNGAGGPILTFRGRQRRPHRARPHRHPVCPLLRQGGARDPVDRRARIFDSIGLREHLTPQRSNGLRSMVERIRADARAPPGHPRPQRPLD